MFFKKKPTLKSIIPDNYVDIHSHVLPAIDDGSKSVDNSIQLLKALREIGFSKMIPTPHTMHGVWENTPETIFDSYMNIKEQLPNEISDMIPHFASEYMVTYDLSKKIESEKLLTFDGKHVLIEFSFMEAPKIIFDIISQLKGQDYEIILAHPERYAYYHDQFFLYEELKSYDVFFQLNLLSTVGYYGSKIANMADKLLQNNMIDFTGSDVHHNGHIDAFDKPLKIKSKDQLLRAMNNNSKLLNSSMNVKQSLAK